MKDAGIAVRSGGTDVHLVLVDLRDAEIDGKQAEDLLHEIHITVNRNAVPNDPRPPMVTSGLRIGTPALATRGFGDTEFTEVADIIAQALTPTPAPTCPVCAPGWRPSPPPTRSTPTWPTSLVELAEPAVSGSGPAARRVRPPLHARSRRRPLSGRDAPLDEHAEEFARPHPTRHSR